ncbi:MAG: hypothetical protein WCK86_05305 [Planctomycetia bacterium]
MELHLRAVLSQLFSATRPVPVALRSPDKAACGMSRCLEFGITPHSGMHFRQKALAACLVHRLRQKQVAAAGRNMLHSTEPATAVPQKPMRQRKRGRWNGLFAEVADERLTREDLSVKLEEQSVRLLSRIPSNTC